MLPDGAKPISEPMLTCHHSIHLRAISQEVPMNLICNLCLESTLFKITDISPRGQWVNKASYRLIIHIALAIYCLQCAVLMYGWESSIQWTIWPVVNDRQWHLFYEIVGIKSFEKYISSWNCTNKWHYSFSHEIFIYVCYFSLKRSRVTTGKWKCEVFIILVKK